MSMLRHSQIVAIEKALERQKEQNFDPFLNLARIPSHIEFAEAVLGNPLDKWQREYMLAAPKNARVAIAASRQSGKSTATALFVAYYLIFNPNVMVLVASRSLRQASSYLDKVREAVLAIYPRKSLPQLNRLSMELPNGSTIISVPTAQPDAGRGFSPQLMVIDEAAFAPEALFTAIMPSVAATHGALHMISSPNGRQGRFFEAFEGEAVDVYWAHRVTWMDCPRMTEAQMELERRAMGDFAFRQEFLSEFLTPLGAFFNADAIQRFEDLLEDQDYTNLELNDLSTLEEIVDDRLPILDPTIDDMRAAFDQTQRVRNVLFGE